jgi:hypothetical protein
MVATPHSQQNPGVMRKGVGQSIDWVLWQANSKESARDAGVIHNSLDLTQTSPRNFCIDMEKPKDVATRGARTSIHLCCPATLAYDKLIAKALREIGCAV